MNLRNRTKHPYVCKQRIPGNRSGSLRIRRDGKERWVHKNANAATIARFQTSAMEMYVHAILSRLRWMPIVARERSNETGTTMPTDQASDGYALRTAADLMSDSPVDILASSVPLADDGAIPTYCDKVEYSVVGRGPARNRALPCG